MAVSLTPAISRREREIEERAARNFHGKARPQHALFGSATTGRTSGGAAGTRRRRGR